MKTKEEINEILECWEMGMTINQVADETGIDHKTVQKYVEMGRNGARSRRKQKRKRKTPRVTNTGL